MNTEQHGLGGRKLIIATLAVLVLTACGTRKNQGQISSVKPLPAMQLVQQNAKQSSLKPTGAHSPSRQVTSSHHVPFSDKENVASHNENAPNTTLLESVNL
jgi:hypothetical protein